MSIHDLVEPLDPSAIRQGRQIRLRPGECAVVFSAIEHGLVAQAIVAHPELREMGSDAQAVAALMTWAVNQHDIRERLNKRLKEIRKEL